MDDTTPVGKIEITTSFVVTRQDVDYLLVAALEGGITYWCDKVEIVGDWPEDAHFASECLSRNRNLMIHDYEEDTWHTLTLESFLEGIKNAMNDFGVSSFEQFMDDHDAGVADVIVQWAIFGEVLYG